MKSSYQKKTSLPGILRVVMVLLFAIADLGGSAFAADGNPAMVGVSTSWLGRAIADVAGDSVSVTCISPPGTCPGHFDMKPGDFEKLRQCQVLFRFDFQSSLDEKLAAISDDGIRVISVPAPEGLCVPERYLKSCLWMGDELARLYPEKKPLFDERAKMAGDRLTSLGVELRANITNAGLKGTRVVASGHQAEFCKWLGLEVVATYSGGEAASPAELTKLVDGGRSAGVRYVITNLQEGRQMGEALAYHLEAKTVVFSNFPDDTGARNTFDGLVRDNVSNLLKAGMGQK